MKLSARDVLRLELLFCALPLFYYLLRLPLMPDSVPVHWNFSGEATRYAPRFSFDMLFISLLGYLGLLLGAVLRKLICLISDTQNRRTVLHIMRWNEALMCLLFTGMAAYDVNCISLCTAPGPDFVLKLSASVIALAFIILGNIIPKMRRNSISGVRTAYSLSSDEAWYRTQRHVGSVMLVTGCLLLVAALLPVVTGIAALLSAGLCVVVICAAAVCYRQHM